MFYHQWNFLIGYATHSLFCDRKYQAFSVRFLTKWQLLLRIFRAVWKGFRSFEQLVDLYLKQLHCLLLIMHDSWPPQLSHDKKSQAHELILFNRNTCKGLGELKKPWKHSPAAHVPTGFLVLPNFHLCFNL